MALNSSHFLILPTNCISRRSGKPQDAQSEVGSTIGHTVWPQGLPVRGRGFSIFAHSSPFLTNIQTGNRGNQGLHRKRRENISNWSVGRPFWGNVNGNSPLWKLLTEVTGLWGGHFGFWHPS